MIGRATSRWLLIGGAVRAPVDHDLHFDPQKGRTMSSVPGLGVLCLGVTQFDWACDQQVVAGQGWVRAPGDPDLQFDPEKGRIMSSVPGLGVLCLGVTHFDWACDQQMVAEQGRGARAGGPRPAV